VRDREKAAKWADQGVELVDGDWNDATAIAAALKGVEGAFVMLPAVWARSPDYREAKGVIANYVEALTKVVPPRVVALSSMGAHRTSLVGNVTALSLLEQGFSNSSSSSSVKATRTCDSKADSGRVVSGGISTSLSGPEMAVFDFPRSDLPLFRISDSVNLARHFFSRQSLRPAVPNHP
jgi:hypothetical protein